MNLTFLLDVEPELMTAEVGYERLGTILKALAPLHPNFSHWYWNPKSAKDVAFPYEDKTKFIERTKQELEHEKAEFPGFVDDEEFSALVTTSNSHRTWKEHGRVALSYAPKLGQVSFALSGVEKIYPDPALSVRLLTALVQTTQAAFANCNVQQRSRRSGQLELYSLNHGVFPHRKHLGWMGFVPKVLKPDDLPEGTQVKSLGTKGSIVIAVNELFDLDNPEHIRHANEVEVELAELELLPVIDQSLL